MTKRIFAATIVCPLLVTPALADLSAEDVLADQLNLLSGNGSIEVRTTGTSATSSGLRVDGYVMTFTAEGADHEIQFDGVEMREMGDGSVEILYPDALDFRMTSEGENVDINEAIFTLGLDDMSHIVSGDPGDITHDISFARAALEDIRMSPPDAVPEMLDYEVAITDASTRIRLDDSTTLRREADFDIGAMILRMALPESDPNASWEEIDNLDATLQLTGLKGQGSYLGSELPEHRLDMRFDEFSWRQSMSGDDLEAMDFTMAADDLELAYDIAISLEDFEDNLAAALASGQRIDARVNYASIAFGVDAVTDEGRFRSASSAGETSGTFQLDRTGFAMQTATVDNTADMVFPPSPEMPITALAYSIARSFMEVDVPFLPNDDLQPFRLAFALEGVEMAEDIWAIFDPAQNIPRDPLNLELELDGTTRITEDPFLSGPGEFPFEESEARLSHFRLNLGGAELTATGEIEDKSRDGVPAGAGQLDMQLTGFNTLLDTLITMGLVTDEQAMPARMALGLIARPGDEPDTLVSTIEILEDGTILANGQRIK